MRTMPLLISRTGSVLDGAPFFLGQRRTKPGRGLMIITVQPTLSQGQPVQSYLYSPATGQLINITALPGGLRLLSAALNNKDQVVGNGFLYRNGTIQTLLSLIPAGIGWSNLNAIRINDVGQIVGQGTYNGQEVAFLMSPEAVPEPSTFAIWSISAAAGAAQLAKQGATKRLAKA
jgi:hypothetical protein